MSPVPVIAIDGPTASGKGTIAEIVAKTLGLHYLDSGALYRLVALAAQKSGIAFDSEGELAGIAASLDARFEAGEIWLAGERVTDQIRLEAVGLGASRVAALPGVRAALLERQRGYRKAPGLVADRRDMGSVVFADAALKVFLTASAEARAERRHKQLKQKGIPASIDVLLSELRERDVRDASRSIAPLAQTPDARLLDSTSLGIQEVAQLILGWYRDVAAKH
ncbi:MAG: (d)CMP kinase [Proteobacteria bacterium]|nr:(d)CMP kinase [Pseudomonadota bacterium]